MLSIPITFNSDKGKFNAVSGQTCSECMAGFFQEQNTNPSLSCKACPAGYDSILEGSSSCSDLGGIKPSDCKDDEYFNETTSICKRCPLGSSCYGPIIWSQVKAKFGWQQCSNNSKKFAQCSFPGACLGGPNSALAGKFLGDNKTDLAQCPDCKALGTNHQTSCSNCSEKCNKQYVEGSRLCGQCASKYSLDGLSGKCKEW